MNLRMIEVSLTGDGLLRLAITRPDGARYLDVTGPPRIVLDDFLEWIENNDDAIDARGSTFRSVLRPER